MCSPYSRRFSTRRHRYVLLALAAAQTKVTKLDPVTTTHNNLPSRQTFQAEITVLVSHRSVLLYIPEFGLGLTAQLMISMPKTWRPSFYIPYYLSYSTMVL